MATYPRPQRDLRAPIRPAARIIADADLLPVLAAHLTPRDRWMIRLIHEHRVLTSHQLIEAAWDARRSANERLLQLYRWRLLDRFQPLLGVGHGQAPAHYILDTAGAQILAAEDGIPVKDTGYNRENTLAIAHSLRLAHTIAVNGFFTALIAHARHPNPPGSLTAWWPETRCFRAVGDLVRPDAYGRWHTTGGRETAWYLELDWATERTSRLARKIGDYAQLAAATHPTPILFWFPTLEREIDARRALTGAIAALDQPHHVPVATTAAPLAPDDARLDPTLTRWLPIPAGRTGRLPLDQLHHAWPRLPAPPPATARPAGLSPPAPMPPSRPRG
ncbi:replication-relaxation family protein [Frankia sp. AgB1.9]|uniref:replication-relaxation family protein n=1 Tax=unclassified Frankia TaxID=2632575 RepID=UPI001933A2CE|nr:MULTISPECIES: replication-relaxation family protein [unclassified Frankia]MBL7487796.1 replication-relaxation family protein [Frankia sp. AgW1.1]MBL7553199.1 replication-relaxation family protein [Frankia sp. AgB1.9]MBL7622956.1 replication-relaxation family protein [Frankia sp. AgB1.8]